MQVLLVDDDDFALEVLDATLSRMGFSAIKVHDGAEAMEVLRRGEIRLVVTDWEMPGMNGVDLCRAIRREDLSGYIYIIMLTGREGAKQRLEGLCAGADDFLNKPLDPEELLVCLKTAERILSLETRDLALFALAKLAESRDSETGAHVERVQSYARIIAQNLSPETRRQHNVDDEYIRLLHQTSALHDLGKVGIPDAILLKPSKLTPDEYAIIKTHTIIGAQTLEAALTRFPNARFLQMARDIALYHHEKFDGSGYPHGLAGEQIPLCARIVAVADVYDTVTSRRVYKEAASHEQAVEIIVRERGGHFDPEVVDSFRRSELQIVSTSDRLRDVCLLPSAPASLADLPQGDLGVANPCKILLVEDDPLILKQLIQIIGATGESLLWAHNGGAALRIMSEQRPRLVVSDWVMEGGDGVELCRRIREMDSENPVHFIMLTAHSERKRLLEAYRAGVDDFLAKPFDPEELLARVRAGLRITRLREDLLKRSVGSQALNSHLAQLNSRLERLSITDELTGAFNRRHAMMRLEEQWDLSCRYNRPLTIAMIDIDHFKNINDTFGHDGGDVILRDVTRILRDCTRGTDALCRVGGEEFMIVFPQQTAAEAMVVAERCRAAMAAAEFSVGNQRTQTTISVGLGARENGMTQFTDVLKAADDALYAAKRAGRNRVIWADRIEDKNIMQTVQNEKAQAAIDATGRPPVDWDAVVKRCGGDPKFADKVVDRFAKQAIGEVAKIEAALAAVDAETVRRAAHSLKSMAAYVAADAASALAKQIEDLGRENRLADALPLVAQLRTQIELATNWILTNRIAATAA
ncbi:MAG: response regulator [Tepidisphaeraceae bacterium]